MTDKRKNDLAGKRFGRWLAVSLDDTIRDGKGRWRCHCDCGTDRVVSRSSLLDGGSRSCGCLTPAAMPQVARYRNVALPLSHPFAVLINATELPYRPGYCMIGEHRIILFSQLGCGPHRCFWCNCLIDWVAALPKIKQLTVDHLDNNGKNNDLDNIVPACKACNSRRDSGPSIVSSETLGHGHIGEYNGRHKLTAVDVASVRAAYTGSRGEQAKFAAYLGLKKAQMSKILNGSSWQDLEGAHPDDTIVEALRSAPPLEHPPRRTKQPDPDALARVHGTHNCYATGCHCDKCRAGHAEYARSNRVANSIK